LIFEILPLKVGEIDKIAIKDFRKGGEEGKSHI
jgi:hypothetical protein